MSTNMKAVFSNCDRFLRLLIMPFLEIITKVSYHNDSVFINLILNESLLEVK